MKIAVEVSRASTTSARILVKRILADQTPFVLSSIREPAARALKEWYQVQLLKLLASDLRLCRARKIEIVLKDQLVSMTSAVQFAPTMLAA